MGDDRHDSKVVLCSCSPEGECILLNTIVLPRPLLQLRDTQVPLAGQPHKDWFAAVTVHVRVMPSACA